MPVNSFDNYPMTWKPNITNKTGPLYKVLSALLEEDIKNGVLKLGDRIGTDPLIYSGVKTLAKMLGIQLVPIMQEMNEMSPIALKNYCRNNELKGIYLIPDHQNPITHTMSLKTRKKIAEVAKEFNLIIIEDGINSILSENISLKSLP